MRNKLISLFAALLFALPVFAQGQENISRAAGVYVASQYGVNPLGVIAPGAPTTTGAVSYTMEKGDYVLPDGRDIVAFFPGQSISFQDANGPDTATITSTSGCALNAPPRTCVIGITVVSAHGQGARLYSASFGLAEAAEDAASGGLGTASPNAYLYGGQVVIDSSWTVLGGTDVIARGLNPQYPNVQILDQRFGSPQWWNLTPALATTVAAPATLVSTTAFSSLTVAGSASYTGGTIHVRISYVDIYGNRGPASADYSFADTSAKAIQFTAPIASAGAVGYVINIGLESGAAGAEYEMPLVTQPTVLGVAPVSNGVCTLTLLESTTPACAVANTNYGQVGSGAVVTGYPVVTSRALPAAGGVSTTSIYVTNSGSRTVYLYAPGSHPSLNGFVTSFQAFAQSAALGSTVPFVLGNVPIPPGFMNYVGRKIEICGQIVDAAGGANTITAVQFRWDAQGSNLTTAIPTLIGGPKITTTQTNVAQNWSFCQQIVTTVASATATGGSLFATNGWLIESAIGAGTAPAAAPNIATAAIASLNLAENADIEIVFVETTGTTATPKLVDLSVKVLN